MPVHPEKSPLENILKKPEGDLVINLIVDRYRKGLYSLVMVTGLPGTGKSSTCFRLKELTAEAFPNKKVTTKVISSLADLAKFAMEAKAEQIHIGVVEEVSTLFPSRRAMAGDNVDLARVLDTCRKKRVILLANAPLWTSIDSHMRAMGNVYIETQRIYKKIGIVISKFFRLQTNPGSGKTYTHTMLRNGREVKRMYTRMPEADSWKAYETDKDKFMEQLYIKINKRAEQREEKENKSLGIETNGPRKARPLLPNEMLVYQMRMTDRKTFREIGEAIGVGTRRAGDIMENALKKLNFSKDVHPKSAPKTILAANNITSGESDGVRQIPYTKEEEVEG